MAANPDPRTGTTGPVPAEVMRSSAACQPWAVHQTPYAIAFRGRMTRGTVLLPRRPAAGADQSVTFGLANTPILLKSLGGSAHVPAHTPWAVANGGGWRIVVDQPTDLRLIHGDRLSVPGPTTPRRPIRFESRAAKVMRVAIASATPTWLDDQRRPVKNLAQPDLVSESPAGWAKPEGALQHDDAATAFALMATWALGQHTSPTDLRVTRLLEYVNSNLADPALSVSTLAATCGVSRRTLQTLFSEHGGPTVYIRRQRLARVIEQLIADPSHFPDLDEVATATGLGSRRTLERAMRQVYGLTPGQARSQVLAGRKLHPLTDATVLAAS